MRQTSNFTRDKLNGSLGQIIQINLGRPVRLLGQMSNLNVDSNGKAKIYIITQIFIKVIR